MYTLIKTLSVIRVMNYVTEGAIRKLRFSVKLIALSRFLLLFSGAASMSPTTINGNYFSVPSLT